MKKSIFEIGQLVNAINGATLPKNIDITEVAFDTRQITPGSLFVPLKGSQDGHDFIEQAIKKGAKTAFWSRDVASAPKDFPIIQVTDTLTALQLLAKKYLKEINPKVIAITGSNGKTTTKDMTAAVLSSQYQVHKTNGNFNNHIGMPLTILSMPEITTHLVLEMGMNHAGELAVLSQIAEPDVALITMIGDAHIEFFGTRDKIADAKMEITTALKPTGTFIFNGDEPLLVERATEIGQVKKTFGLQKQNDLFAENIRIGQYETIFDVSQLSETSFKIPVLGAYNVSNALGAISVGLLFDITIENIQQALADFQLTKNRTEWEMTKQGVAILNDAYNANPTAMKSVIDVFSQVPCKGRRIAVLGDMLELGGRSKDLHESLATHLDPEKISFVFLYGEAMSALYDKLKTIYPAKQLFYFDSVHKSEMIQMIQNNVLSGDNVLVKASFGTHLVEVVDNLMSPE